MSRLTRVISSAAVLVFLAGCGGGTSSPVAPATGAVGQSESIARRGVTRYVPGPAVAGPLAVSPVDSGPGFYPESAKTKPTLFVADLEDNAVVLFPANVKNPTAIGKITQGVNTPTDVATDAAGTLYVVNDGGNTVELFPKGKTSPSLTIKTGIDGPYGIAVDSKGTVYVSNINSSSVTEYPKGKTSPSLTITQGLLNPVGLAVDVKDNLYIADDELSTIYEVAPGSTQTKALPLTGLAGPIGVKFSSDGSLYVTNFAGPNLSVYPKLDGAPSRVITSGMVQPILFGFDASGVLFVSNQTGTIPAFEPKKNTPFETIDSIARPDGIASNPKLKL